MDHILWYRLKRSGLIQPFSSMEECARALVGIQAQIEPAAAISLWNRTPGSTMDGFEHHLYNQKSLVKIWGQRGTLHAYPSGDWPMITAAKSIRKTWWQRTYEAGTGDEEGYEQLVTELQEYLVEHREVTRSELRESGVLPDHDLLSPWGGILGELVHRGYACHAGKEGGEGRFASRGSWLPELEWSLPEHEEANIEIARRYLHTYGPSSAKDLAYWRGARISEARRWLAALDEVTVTIDHEGESLIVLEKDMEELLSAPPQKHNWPIHMLYRFDPLLLGHKNKDWLVDQKFYDRVWRTAGHINGTILIGGRIKGTWNYKRREKVLDVAVESFGGFSKKAVKVIERRANELARFFGLEAGVCEVE